MQADPVLAKSLLMAFLKFASLGFFESEQPTAVIKISAVAVNHSFFKINLLFYLPRTNA
jgi:hypothetical protein